MSVKIKTMKMGHVITSVITTSAATTAPVAMDTSFILTTGHAKVLRLLCTDNCNPVASKVLVKSWCFTNS